jgi:hypothetical protein
MGIMICDTHGRVGFVEACSHVAKQIERKAVPDGHRLTIMGNLFVCNDCFKSLGFDRFASLAELPLEEVVGVTDGRMEAFETAYEAIEGRRGFCLKCLAELEARSPATPMPNAAPENGKR